MGLESISDAFWCFLTFKTMEIWFWNLEISDFVNVCSEGEEYVEDFLKGNVVQVVEIDGQTETGDRDSNTFSDLSPIRTVSRVFVGISRVLEGVWWFWSCFRGISWVSRLRRRLEKHLNWSIRSDWDVVVFEILTEWILSKSNETVSKWKVFRGMLSDRTLVDHRFHLIATATIRVECSASVRSIQSHRLYWVDNDYPPRSGKHKFLFSQAISACYVLEIFFCIHYC